MKQLVAWLTVALAFAIPTSAWTQETAAPAAATPAQAAATAPSAPAAAPAPVAAPTRPELVDGSKINSGDTAWMLASTALVLLMTIPGLALFYGGMVRKKNVLATLMQSFTLVYSGVATFIILKVIDLSIGLRVGEQEERGGLDVSLHGEQVQ